MRFKILLFVMALTLFISLGASVFLFYILTTMDDKPVEAAAMNDQIYTENEESTTHDAAQGNANTDTSVIPDGENASTKSVEINKDEPFRIIAAGDILMGRTVKIKVEAQKDRYIYPFVEVADFLKTGDVVFGNLEESITASTKGLAGIHEGGKYVLKNEPEAVNGLSFAGFNLLSLANNHILDYYEKGLFDTLDILDKNNIAHAGAGSNLDDARKLAVIEKKGLKVGLLAYTDMSEILYKGNPPLRFAAQENKPGVAPTKLEYIIDDIKKARASVDILIVSLHWGIEYSYEPTSKQVEIAHQLIDNGADIILGHHTHRCQGVEIYNGKPIFYSMGNFLFDQNDPYNQESFFFDMTFTDKKLTALEGIPFKILNKSRIVPQKGSGASEMLQRENELISKLNTKSRVEDDRIVFNLD